jgi:hypothetical protein
MFCFGHKFILALMFVEFESKIIAHFLANMQQDGPALFPLMDQYSALQRNETDQIGTLHCYSMLGRGHKIHNTFVDSQHNFLFALASFLNMGNKLIN